MNEIFHKEISKQKHKKMEDLLKLQLKFELSKIIETSILPYVG